MKSAIRLLGLVNSFLLIGQTRWDFYFAILQLAFIRSKDPVFHRQEYSSFLVRLCSHLDWEASDDCWSMHETKHLHGSPSFARLGVNMIGRAP